MAVNFTDLDDVPLTEPTDGVEGQDLPLQELGKPKPVYAEPLQNMFKAHASLIKADLDGTDVFQAYTDLEAAGEDPRGEVGRYASERVNRSRKELREYVEDIIGQAATPDGVIANVQTWQDLDAELDGEAASIERQITESVRGELTPEEQELAKVESELLVINTLANIQDNYGTVEKAFDIAKMFLPTTVIDNTQLSGFPLGTEEYLRQAVVGLKDLQRNDPTTFNKVFPELVEELNGTLPKNKVLELVSAIANPRGEEELNSFSNLDAVLDIVDVGASGVGVALSLAKLSKRVNAIRLAARLKNKELAADINAAAVIDETGEAAKKAGVDKETAYNSAAPFNVSELDEGYAEGLSGDVIARIEETRRRQLEASEELIAGKGFLREQMLTDEQRLAAEEGFYKELQAEGLFDVNVIYRDPVETTFAYKVKNDQGELISDTRTMPLTIDQQTGYWKHTEKGQMLNFITSPTVFAKFAKPDVEAALRLDSTSAVVANTFNKLQADALRPLLGTSGIKNFSPTVRKELAQVDEVLLAGDNFKDKAGNRGKVYTVSELRSGAVNGVRLNDRQIETYYNVRSLYDELHHIRDVGLRRHLVAQGYKEVRMADGSPQIGKVHTLPGATATLNSSGGSRVYDAVANDYKVVRGEDLERLYNDEGKSLVQLRDPVDRGDDGWYNMVLVDSAKVGDLPQSVLHYRPGYVPKTDKTSRWFVKELGERTLNGVVVKGQPIRTVRKFATKAEADLWLSKQDNKDSLTLLPDRGMEQQITGSSQIGAGGGLYTGPRAEEDIPYGMDGLPAERLNTYEALAHNLQSLERLISRDQWRAGMQQKWVNSAKMAGFTHIDTYEPALIPEGDPRGVGLRRMAEQIDIWSGFPSASEQKWDGLVTGVMEWMTSKWPEKAKGIARGGQAARESDPISMVRSTTFRLLLGMFSPVQLWVQAQGAAIAVALHPGRAARALPIQMAMSAAQVAGKGGLSEKVLSKLAGLKVEEFRHLQEAFRKSGYKDSLFNLADYSAASRGAGLMSDQVGKALDKTSVFYRTGESINRRLSFTIAALKHYEKTGSFFMSDKALKGVITDANHTMLDLSKANAAKFQRGIVSVPTQFFQVQVKFMETLLGLNDNFTVAERIKIGLGQLTLYGAAGVPLAGLATRTMTEAAGLTQQDIDNLNPATVEAMNQGFWGLLFNTWLGGEVDVAGRGAIAEGMVETVLNLIASDATIGETLVGASGSLPYRFFTAFSEIKPMIMNDRVDNITREEVISSASILAQVTSSWNNFQKGMFILRTQRIVDGRGNPIVDGKELTMTAYMQMIGFQPKDVNTTFELERLVRGRDEFQAGVADALIEHYWNYVNILHGVTSPAKRERIMENYEAGTRTLMASLGNDGERASVRERVRGRLTNPQTRQERAIKNYLETFSDGQVANMGNLLDAARTQGLIQIQPTKE